MIKEIIATGVDANAAIESGALLLGLPRDCLLYTSDAADE